MPHSLWTLVLLLCGCAVARVPPAAPGAEVVRYPVEQHRLGNGLEVVLEQSPDFGRAGAVLLVGAGSADEAPDQAGLAHLVEHLAFEATPGGSASRGEEWEALGGDFNGFTDWDSTTYEVFVPPKSLGALLASLSSLLRDPLASVDDRIFDHERRIVTNELGYRTDGTRGALDGLAASVFPPDHAYAHPLGGSRDGLPRLTLAAARAFARAHYRTENATLVVTAPLSPSAVQGMVDRSFGVLRGGERRALPSPTPAGGRESAGGLGDIPAREAPVSVPELWIGWAVPNALSAEGDIADLVAEMIGGTFWSNVYQRDDDISRVDAGVVPGARASLFFLRATLKEGGNPGASARSVVREMQRGLGERTQSPDSFDIYRRFLATDRTYLEEHPVTRAVHMAWSAHFTDEPGYLRGRGERLVALTSAQVGDYYGEFLTPKRARAVLLRPARQGVAGPLDALGPAAGERAGAVPPDARVAYPWLVPIGAARARRARLDSGLEVFVLPQPGSPFHSVILGFHGGDPEIAPASVVAATRWAVVPTGRHPALRGISYAQELQRDSMRFVIRSTGSNLRATLELLREAADKWQVTWPIPQFSSQLTAMEKQDRSPESELERAITRALYGSHPYGQRPRPAEIGRVTAKQIHDYFSEVVRGDNGALVIVGDVDADLALAEARRAFSGFHRSPRPTPPVSAPPHLTRSQVSGPDRIIVQHQPGSAQVALTFRCVLPPGDDDPASLDLFRAALERRVFAELRGKRAASYSVAAARIALRGGTQLLELRADADHARLDRVLSDLRGYLEQPSGTALGPDSLARARAAIARTFNLEHSTTLDVAQTLFERWNRDLPLEGADRDIGRVWTTELDAVNTVSEYCRNNWVLGLRGDAARIRAAWGRALASPATAAEARPSP